MRCKSAFLEKSMLNKFVFTSEYLETVLYHRCAADQSRRKTACSLN